MHEFGITKRSELTGVEEEITLLGYSIIPNLYTPEEIYSLATKLDEVFKQQESSFGKDMMLKLKEHNICCI